jgi:hypothetical protein
MKKDCLDDVAHAQERQNGSQNPLPKMTAVAEEGEREQMVSSAVERFLLGSVQAQ